MLWATDRVGTRPSVLRSSGTSTMPASMRSATLAPVQPPVAQPDLAGGLRAGRRRGPPSARCGRRPSARRGPGSRPRGPRARRGRGGSRRPGAAGSRPRLAAARLAGLVLGAREQRGRRAAHHLLDDPGHVDVGGLGVGHDAAVAQHGDAVADLEQLVELVRDVDDGDASRLEVVDDVEEALDLGLRRAPRWARP